MLTILPLAKGWATTEMDVISIVTSPEPKNMGLDGSHVDSVVADYANLKEVDAHFPQHHENQNWALFRIYETSLCCTATPALVRNAKSVCYWLELSLIWVALASLPHKSVDLSSTIPILSLLYLNKLTSQRKNSHWKRDIRTECVVAGPWINR